MISADPKVLEEGSEVAKRIDDYRALVEDLCVLIIARPWNILGFLRSYRDGARLLKTWHRKEVVVTSQDPFERGCIAWLLAWRFNAPLELQIHTDFLSPWFWRESLKNKTRVTIARFLLPRATTIRVVSERIKRSLVERRIVREKCITTLPIFVDSMCIKNKPSQKSVTSFTFLIVSRFTKEKNIPLALRAFERIYKDYPRTRLIIVGEGPERRRIELRIKNYELGDHIFLKGWQNDLESYWRQADCYLLTSNYEGYGRTAVDALTHGVPVIMTDVGVAGEIVKNEENGLVVPVSDEHALAKAMHKALHYPWRFSRPPLISRKEYMMRVRKNWEYTLRRFSMPRLVYILPEYHPDIGTHFYYLGGFIKKILEHMQIYAIEEKRQRFRLVPKLIGLRLRGVRDFYVHYSFYGALMCIMVTKLFGGRVFYWNCGMPWLYEKERGWCEERIFRFILRHTILVTGTKGMAERYIAYYRLKEDDVRVMPNWIDLSSYRVLPSQERARKELHLPLNKKIVLFAHRLSKRKGAHRIAAIAEALRNVSDTLFVIVGSGPEEKELESRIKNHELGDIIKLKGSIPARRMPLYMRAADIFFMPSDEEGFPHVILEAMATGTPFVASDIGGVSEIIPDEAKQFLCRPDDIICFAKNITYFLYNRNDVAERLPAFVQRYDIGKVAEKFIMLYK